MWPFAIVVLSILALGTTLSRQAEDESALQNAQARAMAERMSVLRSAAQGFAHGHPGFEGELREEELIGLPQWWTGTVGLHVVVEGRVVAVYFDGPAPQGLVPQMLRLSAGSIWVGAADRTTGRLRSPNVGDTGIAVPAAIPDQAPAWLALRE